MSVTTVNTKMSVQQWADLMGVDPLLFNYIDGTTCIEDYGYDHCEEYWGHWQYQKSSVISVEELAVYIRYAEDMIESYLGVQVGPTWNVNEYHELPKYYRKDVSRYPIIENLTFMTNWKNVIAFGKRLLTQIDVIDVSGIVYTDEDGDGFNETATLTISDINLTIDCTHNLRFFYNGHDIGPASEMHYDGTDTIIKFDSWTLVRPELYLAKTFRKTRAFDACNDIYIDTLDVFIESVDDCLPSVELVWNRNNWSQATMNQLCVSCRDDCNCQEITFPACAKILNKCEGTFSIQPVNVDEFGCTTTNCPCNMCVPPDGIRINYLAGCSNCDSNSTSNMLDNWGICSFFQKAVLALSVSDAPTALCGCSCVDENYKYWQRSVWENIEGLKTPNVPQVMMVTNPFGGSKIGHFEAYSIIENLKRNGRLCYKEW